MTSRMLIGSLALAVAAAAVSPAAAQDVTAEVRTWSGQSVQLSQPSLEVFYTIIPKTEEGGGGQGAAAGGAPGAMGSGSGTSSQIGTEVSGSIRSLSKLFKDKGPEPLQGNRQVVTVALTQGGAERRIPLDAIKDLAFKRTQVSNSTLPPYVASNHFTYAASALLIDGSRVDGDYVNLGTAVLRGLSSQGRVDIPWQDIEAIRFSR